MTSTLNALKGGKIMKKQMITMYLLMLLVICLTGSFDYYNVFINAFSHLFDRFIRLC